jgi:ankyrin repeat protein
MFPTHEWLALPVLDRKAASFKVAGTEERREGAMKTKISIKGGGSWAVLAVLGSMLASLSFAQTSRDVSIFAAAAAGKSDAVTAVVTADPSLIDSQDQYGKTPLHYAVCGSHSNLAAYLLTKGASVTTRDNRGWTALHHAAENGSPEIAEMLIRAGAEVNAFNTMHWTALHQAVLRGHTRVVLCLVKDGADVYAQTGREATAYNIAIEYGRVGLRDYLVAQMQAASGHGRSRVYAVK